MCVSFHVVVPLRADAVRNAAVARRRATDAGVEAGSCSAAGAQPCLAAGARVACGTDALERAVAGVEAEAAVMARPAVARVRPVLALVPGEPRVAEALREALRAEKTAPCTIEHTINKASPRERRHDMPPPMAVRLAADLHPSADGSAVGTWLSCRQPACL